ncbi:hypothetical protein JL721_12866 [Aureococcus anophagefferens]|nr:hypothetical protein JL721_12866 [Aureococcus anophagefferens]
MTDAIAAFDARLPPPAFRPFHASQPEFVEAHVDALCRRGPSPEVPPARDEGTSAIMEPTRQPGDVRVARLARSRRMRCCLRGAARVAPGAALAPALGRSDVHDADEPPAATSTPSSTRACQQSWEPKELLVLDTTGRRRFYARIPSTDCDLPASGNGDGDYPRRT